MKKNRINFNHFHRNYEGDFLENKNIIYIDYLDSYMNVFKKLNTIHFMKGYMNRFTEKFLIFQICSFIKKIVYKFLNCLGYVRADGNKIILYCLSNDKVNQRMINNLKKKILIVNSRDVVLSDLLLQNTVIVNLLQFLGYNILRGKWLYKFLCYDIVSKIAYVKNKKVRDLEVTILCNEDSDINIENIKLLAKECKILNVVTEKTELFKYVENLLFEEYGNIINVSTNKAKACKYSDLILNFDFSVTQIKECNFKKGIILVQFTKEKFENRNGSTIVFFDLNLPVKYDELFNEYKNYNKVILYESVLYYRTSFENLREILKNDGVSIRCFEGCNGKLSFNEIKRVYIKHSLDKF